VSFVYQVSRSVTAQVHRPRYVHFGSPVVNPGLPAWAFSTCQTETTCWRDEDGAVVMYCRKIKGGRTAYSAADFESCSFAYQPVACPAIVMSSVSLHCDRLDLHDGRSWTRQSNAGWRRNPCEARATLQTRRQLMRGIETEPEWRYGDVVDMAVPGLCRNRL